MNGRVYDPRLGRFLSPDPYVQAPGYSQSFNRYSYVWNNPLKYTDPDGEWVVIAVFALYSAWNMGVRAGIAAERAGGHFWRDGFWKGAIAGAVVGSAGAFTGGAVVNFFNVGGVFAGAALGGITGAAVGGVGGGLSTWAMGGDFWDGAKRGALLGGIGGAISGGFAGYKLARAMHANIWTGNLDSSLEYIIKAEYGNSIYTEYGIGNHDSKYLVARNSNLPKGYRTYNGLIENEMGDLLWGLAEPGGLRSGDHILGSKVYISKGTIREYFLGDQVFALEKIKHEFFHLRDYYSGNYLRQLNIYRGQGLSGNSLNSAMRNWLEFRAYSFNHNNLQLDFFLERMKWYSNMPWDIFWSIYGY